MKHGNKQIRMEKRGGTWKEHSKQGNKMIAKYDEHLANNEINNIK